MRTHWRAALALFLALLLFGSAAYAEEDSLWSGEAPVATPTQAPAADSAPRATPQPAPDGAADDSLLVRLAAWLKERNAIPADAVLVLQEKFTGGTLPGCEVVPGVSLTENSANGYPIYQVMFDSGRIARDEQILCSTDLVRALAPDASPDKIAQIIDALWGDPDVINHRVTHMQWYYQLLDMPSPKLTITHKIARDGERARNLYSSMVVVESREQRQPELMAERPEKPDLQPVNEMPRDLELVRVLDTPYALMRAKCKEAGLTVLAEKDGLDALKARYDPRGHPFIKGISWFVKMEGDAFWGYQLTFAPSAQKLADKVIPLFLCSTINMEKKEAQAAYEASKAAYLYTGKDFVGMAAVGTKGFPNALLATTQYDGTLTCALAYGKPD